MVVQDFVRLLFLPHFLLLILSHIHDRCIYLFASFQIEKLVQDLWEKKLGPNCFCLHHINHLGAQACNESFPSNFTKKYTKLRGKGMFSAFAYKRVKINLLRAGNSQKMKKKTTHMPLRGVLGLVCFWPQKKTCFLGPTKRTVIVISSVFPVLDWRLKPQPPSPTSDTFRTFFVMKNFHFLFMIPSLNSYMNLSKVATWIG